MKYLISCLILFSTATLTLASDTTEKELQEVERSAQAELERKRLIEENQRLKNQVIASENERLKAENAQLRNGAVASQTVKQPSTGESWYFNFGIGGASVKYPEPIESLYNAIESLPNIKRSEIAVDMGIYFPIGSSSIIGFAMTSVGDRFVNTSTQAWFQANTYSRALSYMYFFQERENGIFARLDIGRSQMGLVDSRGTNVESTNGSSLGIGLGYAFDYGETSFELTYLSFGYTLEGESYSSQLLMIGWLF